MEKILSIIHSGDNNSWVWPKWYEYYSKYWDENKVPTIFLGETKAPDVPLHTEVTGDVNWSNGLIDFLTKLDASHVIYQHEDFFITGTVDFDKVLELQQLMDQHNIDIIKCCGRCAGDTTARLDVCSLDIPHIYSYSLSNNYIISHQMSIWNKDFLLSSLRRDESPWEHEINGTRRARKRNPTVLAYRSKKRVPDSYPIPYIETVRGGEPRQGRKHYFEDSK